MIEPCLLCGEEITLTDSPGTIGTPEGMRRMHRECSLREVMGGVGHVIAHPYWCTQKHNPDAGFSYRESARIVWAIVQIIGTEKAVDVGLDDPA